MVSVRLIMALGPRLALASAPVSTCSMRPTCKSEETPIWSPCITRLSIVRTHFTCVTAMAAYLVPSRCEPRNSFIDPAGRAADLNEGPRVVLACEE